MSKCGLVVFKNNKIKAIACGCQPLILIGFDSIKIKYALDKSFVSAVVERRHVCTKL